MDDPLLWQWVSIRLMCLNLVDLFWILVQGSKSQRIPLTSCDIIIIQYRLQNSSDVYHHHWSKHTPTTTTICIWHMRMQCRLQDMPIALYTSVNVLPQKKATSQCKLQKVMTTIGDSACNIWSIYLMTMSPVQVAAWPQVWVECSN